MNFFFDANLPDKFAQAMNLLDADCGIEHLKDNFPQDVKDEIWLKYVGEKDLVVITRDQKIRKRPAELTAYKRYKVGAFILTGKHMGKWKQIKQLICAWEEIRTLANVTRRPFAFLVPSGGRIQRLDL